MPSLSDLLTNVLLDGHKNGKKGKHGWCMLSIQSIDEVIVRAQFKFVDLEQGFQNAIHVQHLSIAEKSQLTCTFNRIFFEI